VLDSISSPVSSSTPFELVPNELKVLSHWVCWRLETRDGDPTKVPYCVATGRRASTTDPGTWSTFADAVAAVASYDGIGFVLTGDFVGFDFDGMLSESGEAEPYVLEILRLLKNPYAELTPSGRGLRCYVAAPLPPGGNRWTRDHYGIEVYTEKRYFCVTGKKFSGDGIPHLENISLPYFLATQVLDDKFKRLWLGDTTDYAGDDSRADLALMGKFARALNGNAKRMEAAFSASRLGQREKWAREDYRQGTIQKALEGIGGSAVVLDTALTATDSGNAQLVASTFHGRALYCLEKDTWYLADQSERWSADRTGRLPKIVQDVMSSRLAEIVNPKDPRYRHALQSLQYRAMRDCISVLKFQQDLSVLPEQLDCDPLLLGVENGILDLMSGELVAPRLDLMVTKCAPVRFDPKATCPAWLEYLGRVQPDDEVRAFLKRFCGSLLTGLQPEQSFVFFHGVGANGKSVFLRVWSDLLGPDYSFTARKALFFLNRKSLEHAMPNDISDLEGMRLVTSTEQTGKYWNLEFLKAFTGGERLHGRQLYERGRNMKPTGKVVASANSEPTLSEFDEALRRRFICVPWNVVIPEKERVSPLEVYVGSLLRDGGGSGILNWALDGLADLIRHSWRLDPPEEVKTATAEYISAEDRVGQFFKDWFCDFIGANPINTKVLRQYFVAWLDEPEKFVISPHSFTKACRRIFGDRFHKGADRFHVVEGLQLSELGQREWDQFQLNEFSRSHAGRGKQ